jgi:hypothetical protein
MTCIMRPSLDLSEVYIYRQAIDFRNSHRVVPSTDSKTLSLPEI